MQTASTGSARMGGEPGAVGLSRSAGLKAIRGAQGDTRGLTRYAGLQAVPGSGSGVWCGFIGHSTVRSTGRQRSVKPSHCSNLNAIILIARKPMNTVTRGLFDHFFISSGRFQAAASLCAGLQEVFGMLVFFFSRQTSPLAAAAPAARALAPFALRAASAPV